MAEPLADVVERADLDELVRLVDGLCAARDWDALSDLRIRCHRAVERGRQLWPAAAHAEYRLALEAPAPWAGAVLVEGAGRFAPGPLPEVAASTHSWVELEPHVPAGPAAALTAHERAVRGEDVTARPPAGPTVTDLPLRKAGWEPDYLVAIYRADGADFPGPEPLALAPFDLRPPPPARVDAAANALTDVVSVWTVASEGRAKAVAVHGDAAGAIAALQAGPVSIAAIDPAEAFRRLAWAGASGGAHGRRPGAAAGRFAAWWAVAAIAGLAGTWPVDAELVGSALHSHRWFAWDASDRTGGWVLRIAVESDTGASWALDALDAG
jgi:hypothetical protein